MSLRAREEEWQVVALSYLGALAAAGVATVCRLYFTTVHGMLDDRVMCVPRPSSHPRLHAPSHIRSARVFSRHSPTKRAL